MSNRTQVCEACGRTPDKMVECTDERCMLIFDLHKVVKDAVAEAKAKKASRE